MALIVVLMIASFATASPLYGEMALDNVTRNSTGDKFSLIGSDCGLTRCMEASHGTALAAIGVGSGCVCQCRGNTPAFREDRRICVNQVDECTMASFGRGAKQPQIPFVFLPLKGQIIYPSKEIVFTDVEEAVCAVTSAQYLSPSGWVTLRDHVDNDVPFSLYRDEGNTFLQWRGSIALHSRLEGRLVVAHVLCSSGSPAYVSTTCAAFRIAGISQNSFLDVQEISFGAGEVISSETQIQSHGLSVLESLAIGVCALILIFIYAAGIVVYIHYKQKQKRKQKDAELMTGTLSTENISLSGTLDSNIDMDNVRMKTNPLLKMDNDFLHDGLLSDVSEHTEDTLDSSPNNSGKFQKNHSNVVTAMVHTRRKKPSRPTIRSTSASDRCMERLQRRSASPDLERAPHSELSIVDCSVEHKPSAETRPSPDGEPAIRRKLYFNPVFFETEQLKNPPPAAVEFLIKIREVMAIAKEKMTTKRFIPVLSDIAEEEFYHTIDLGWDIPCGQHGRRFSAISLKRENSRRAVHCGGCPGCNSNGKEPKVTLTRSHSCKSCSNEDYKQKIVRKWLDEVPIPPAVHNKPTKSVAKVSGTPRVPEPKKAEEVRINNLEPIRSDGTETLEISDFILVDDTNKTIVKQIVSDNRDVIDDPNRDSKTNNIEIKDEQKDLVNVLSANNTPKEKTISRGTRRVKRRNLPPPPPPPDQSVSTQDLSKEVVKPIPEDVKKKMEAVIRELNECRRTETTDVQGEIPKLVIPVLADDTQLGGKSLMEYDSLERNISKQRRFSLACSVEPIGNKFHLHPMSSNRQKLSRSWRDVRKAFDDDNIFMNNQSVHGNVENEVYIQTSDPVYDNIPKPGPLTIEVRGSPIKDRRSPSDEFEPDTLDRNPKREAKRKVEKILLKSGGSFKFSSIENFKANGKVSPTGAAFTRKIGSLRQIYEAKAKIQNDTNPYIEDGKKIKLSSGELSGFIQTLNDRSEQDTEFDNKPPLPPKNKTLAEIVPKYCNFPKVITNGAMRRSSEDKERISCYSRSDNLNSRRSYRRSARTRSRRTDLKKLCKPEDSGYLSTDSNESKRRAKYLMQFKPKPSTTISTSVAFASNFSKKIALQIESDTDDVESLCDGQSESGGESIETDSVFFGNFYDSKQMLAELGLNSYEHMRKIRNNEDSDFVGDTNVIQSGESDSEHKSVISITAGCDGRASVTSIYHTDENPFD